jgi:hypothetical protein
VSVPPPPTKPAPTAKDELKTNTGIKVSLMKSSFDSQDLLLVERRL